MGAAEGIGSDAEARRLLRQAKRCRGRLLPWFIRRQGHRASQELQEAARRGNLAALRVLARPTPYPDLLFGLVCRDLLASQRAASSLLRKHVYRAGGSYEESSFVHGRRDPVARDLAQLILHPAPAELTESMRRIVAVAAALRDHPLAEIARSKILAAGDQAVVDEVCELAEFVPELAAFCREHGLTPSDPARQPVFWLLAGQYARYNSADPYGSAALAAYAAADAGGQARFRTAAIDGGMFELLRRMVEADGEFADLLAGEQFTELSRGLAQHERWSLLWELLTQVAPAVAVERSHLLPDDWRPSSTADRRLLAELRAAPAELVTATATDPALVNLVRFAGKALTVGFGHSRAAVFTRTASGRLRLEVYGLPGGELVAHREYDGARDPYNVLVCGDDESTVVAVDKEGLWRCGPGTRARLAEKPPHGLLAMASGWAALSFTHLLIGSAQGEVTRRVPLTELGIAPDHGYWLLHAASADGTRLALADDHTFTVVDQTGRTLRTTHSDHPEPIKAIGFLGAGVVTVHQQWTERRKYRIYDDSGDHYEDCDDVTVDVSWYGCHWMDGSATRIALPSLRHIESFEDPQTVFTAYTTRPLRDRVMTRDNRDPGELPPPSAAIDHPQLAELPSSPARVQITTFQHTTQLVDRDRPEEEQPPWVSGREVVVIPGMFLLAELPGDDLELRLYELQREHDDARAAVLALLNRPIPDLREADLATSLDPNAPCLRVLHACVDHHRPSQTSP